MSLWEQWQAKAKDAGEAYRQGIMRARGLLPHQFEPPGCFVPKHPGCLLFGAMPGVDCHDCAWPYLAPEEG